MMEITPAINYESSRVKGFDGGVISVAGRERQVEPKLTPGKERPEMSEALGNARPEPEPAPHELAVRSSQDTSAVSKVVTLERLKVEYRSREIRSFKKVAVCDLTFHVARGEVFGLLGPNGAGKTTTMNVLLGYTRATAGAAYLFGRDVRQPIARQRIGYLPELTYYYKFLTAEELLRFYSRVFRIPRVQREARIDEVLKLAELGPERKRPIRTYSKGMQQRVGIAQALINHPELLILDEPTSGVDPIGRMKVRSLIQRLKDEGRTVLFSSHELGEAETVCDRVAILHEGRLRALGTVDQLLIAGESNLEQAFLRTIGVSSDPTQV